LIIDGNRQSLSGVNEYSSVRDTPINPIDEMGNPLAKSMTPLPVGSCDTDAVGLLRDPDAQSGFSFSSVYVRSKTVAHFSLTSEQVVSLLRNDQAELLLGLFDATTSEEFAEKRHEIARSYWLMSESIRTAMAARLSVNDWAKLARRSIASIITEVSQLGAERIGPDATDDAVFSLSTLGQVPRVLLKLIVRTQAVGNSDPHRSGQLANEFVAHTRTCELHLHLLMLMLTREGLHIRPFAVDAIASGLRSSVGMYAAVREAAMLLASNDDLLSEPLVLDDEDRELLAASSIDEDEPYDHL